MVNVPPLPYWAAAISFRPPD